MKVPKIITNIFILCTIAYASGNNKIWEITNLKLFIQPPIVLRNVVHQNVRNKSKFDEIFQSSPNKTLYHFYIFLENPQTESIEIKKEICKTVFKSVHFTAFREEGWFDTDDDKNRHELKIRDKNLFYSIYSESKRSGWLPFSGYQHGEDVYVNQSIVLTGQLGDSSETDDFWVFKCLVKNRSLREIKAYYVSDAHYVDVAVSSPKFYVRNLAARFIFSPSKTAGPMELVVLAADCTNVGREFNCATDSDLKDFESFF